MCDTKLLFYVVLYGLIELDKVYQNMNVKKFNVVCNITLEGNQKNFQHLEVIGCSLCL